MSKKVCKFAALASAPPPLLDVFAQSEPVQNALDRGLTARKFIESNHDGLPVGHPVSAIAVSGLFDASSATACVVTIFS